MKKKLLVLIAFVIVAFTGSLSYYLTKSVVTDRNGVVFYVPPGMSKKTLIAELHQRGVIRHNWLYTVFVLTQSSKELKSGEYFFSQGSTPYSIWRQIVNGKGFYYRSFMIVPGWTFRQLRQQLDQAEGLRHLTKGAEENAIMTFLGHSDVKPEGRFYPETYNYTRGDQDLVILLRAYQFMQTQLDEAWRTRAPNLPFKTPYDALIAASIVEKEAYLDSERPVIAGVMLNRFKINMPLQFDPTVIYGLGSRYDGKIHKKDLLEDTPYNTYIHKGLTPTPISMPGTASIQAVMHPATHDYLYFVAKGDGSHQFSSTIQAHQVAVDALRAREAAHQSYFFNAALVRQYLLKYTSVTSLESYHGSR